MAKTLKVSFPEKCNGCELCVMSFQSQLKRAGLEDVLIRIVRKPVGFEIELDPKIEDYNVTKIKEICPTGVFTISEGHGKLLT